MTNWITNQSALTSIRRWMAVALLACALAVPTGDSQAAQQFDFTAVVGSTA